MTLVQNLLQRLSGSKTLICFFLFSVFISGCDTVRIASKPNRTKKKSKTYRKKKSHVKVDTVEWAKDPLDPDNPITDDMPLDYGYDIKSEVKTSYNIAIMLPLRSKMNINKSEWSKSSLRFINYYGGLQMALEDLKKQGVNLNVNIFDSEYSLNAVKKLWTNKALRNADLIIGPYRKDALKYSAIKAKKLKIGLISPWISSPNITDSNPFYIQAKCGLSSHYESILKNAYENFDKENVYVLVKEGDDSKRKEMESIYANISQDHEMDKLNFVDVVLDTVKSGIYVIDTLLIRDKKETAFVLPYASSKDKDFVYSFVQKIELIKSEDKVTIYGFYKWLDFSEEMYEYFNRMDLRLSVSGLVDPTNSEVNKFKRRYFKKYGTFPTRDAYEGYDLMLYTGNSLDKWGDKFHVVKRGQEKTVGIQTVFNIQPKISVQKKSNRISLDYFENEFIEIVGFDNFQLKIIN